MEMNGRAVLQRLRGGQQIDAAIDVSYGAKDSGFGQDVAPRQFGWFDVGQVHGGALAGNGVVRLEPVHLDTAHPEPSSCRVDLDLLLSSNRTRNQGSGDDSAESLHRKNAI